MMTMLVIMIAFVQLTPNVPASEVGRQQAGDAVKRRNEKKPVVLKLYGNKLFNEDI